VRLVREVGGTVTVDPDGTKPGRGAYVCGDAVCLERGLRGDRLARALGAPCRLAAQVMENVVEHARRRDAMARASVK
jgi:predicted RNA-binding protein YlxR (DUF448 family)